MVALVQDVEDTIRSKMSLTRSWWSLYCESGKWILYFFDEYGWFSTLSLLKRPFHSKAQGLQVGGRVSQLLRLAGDHLPNKDWPALPAAPQCPALRLPPATPSAPPPRSGHRHREPAGHSTGHRYRTTGKARWHCGRRSTSLILSFRQLLSPARVGRLQQRVEYQLDRLVMISFLILTFVFVDHRLANMRALR